MRKSKLTVALAVAAMALGLATAERAVADDWSDKPLTIIVGFPAGGGLDRLARYFGESLGDTLGTDVVVQNRPGAGGAIAASAAKQAKPDGHTLVMVVSSTYTDEPNLEKLPYKSGDFHHLAAVAQFLPVFVTNANEPWANLTEMIADAKASGKELKYGSMTQIDRYYAKYIAEKSGVTITPVPMKGGPAIMAAILGGHVDFGFSGSPHYPYVKAGQMRVLAVTGDEPVDAFPDAPTLRSLGYDINQLVYAVISVPEGVPDDRIADLEAGLQKAMAAPEYAAMLDKMNLKKVAVSGEALQSELDEQAEVTAELVKTLSD